MGLPLSTSCPFLSTFCPFLPAPIQVDCTQEMDLCRAHFITGFPSIRVFRKGHDDIYVGGSHEHESYTGDSTLAALTSFADSLVPSAGQPHHKHAQLAAAPKTSGCNMAGGLVL